MQESARQAATHRDMSGWVGLDVDSGQHGGLAHQGMYAYGTLDWFCGPAMLQKPFEQWNIKFGKASDEPTPGEKITATHAADAVQPKETLLNYDNFSSAKKVVQLIGCTVGVIRKGSLSPAVLKKAEKLLGKEIQCAVDMHSPDCR